MAAGALTCALLAAPTGASAANPPACDPSVYPTPFLLIDGSIFARNTRYLKLRQNPRSTVNQNGNGDSDPEYPFPVRVDRTRHAPRTFTVHDYAKDQFPVSFLRPETAVVKATYVEVHTEYVGLIVTVLVRCTRTVTKTFHAPPRQRRPGGGGGGGGGGGDDGQGQGQGQGDDH
jgi:hypothetical protein